MSIARITLIIILLAAPGLFACGRQPVMSIPPAGSIPFAQDGMQERVAPKPAQPGPIYTTPKPASKKTYKKRTVKRKTTVKRPVKKAVKKKVVMPKPAALTPPIPLPLTEDVQPGTGEQGDRLGIYDQPPNREPEPLQ